jgi:peptidyl-prolyl cis-trans isomerase B (cyclophilin B)
MLAILYNATPKHQDNFLKLVNENFFNDLLFHRVINGFMIQGGDPNSRNAPASMSLGTGSTGYQIPAEFVDSLVHTKGALAAARTNNPKKESSGCQFYIVQGRPIPLEQLEFLEMSKNFKYSSEAKKYYQTIGGTPVLDREYTVFGRVVKGIEVIDKIAAVQTGSQDRPTKDVKMKIRVVK